jgi:ABC-type cobalamin/Fe3+-siderophores transport system ATPase subunit
MAPPLLRLDGIRLTFGGAPLLDGAGLAVLPGDRIALVGRNGSGKSTLLRIAAGLAEPQDGEVFRQPSATIRYLPQEPDLEGFATVRAYVEAGLGPADDPHRATYLLEHLGLTGGEKPTDLSGGEARRAALARVLAPRPDILLLDEPTAFLDLSHQFELMDLLSELKDHGVTVVASMHELWLAALYCHRIIAMSDGRIVASGPTDEVLTPELLREVFGVEVALREHPTASGKTIALPYRRRRAAEEPVEHPEPVPSDVESPHAAT